MLLPEPLDTGRISVCPEAQAHPRHTGLGDFENLHVLERFSSGPAPLWFLGREMCTEWQSGFAFTSLKGGPPLVPHLRPLSSCLCDPGPDFSRFALIESASKSSMKPSAKTNTGGQS